MMERSELAKLCDPLTPEEALQQLQELQEALHLTVWGSGWWPGVTAGINVFQALGRDQS